MSDATITIPAGELRGVTTAGVRAFFGVPYAAPPVGPLRFALPASAKPWTGVRDATRRGAIAPQTNTPAPGVALDLSVLLGPEWTPGDDDYLTVNVWTPEGADVHARLPVLVWIHGGGFIAGSKDIGICDGATFARDGVICVSINYRLGIEGFLPIPGAPTNLGFRDQIAALAWVRDTIAVFGGDPANVTIFGESAGAGSVGYLMGSPLAKGLFRRAILESGHAALGRTIPTAQKVVHKLARHLGVSPDVEGFRTVPIEKALAAQDWVAKARIDLRDDGVDSAFGISRFFPVYGDDVAPVRPDVALRAGAASEVDMLIGTTADEMNAFTVPSGLRDKIGGLLAILVLRGSFPRARSTLKAYGLGRKGVKPGQALTDATNDLIFREPARRFAEAHRGRSHVFEFEWGSTLFDGELGACHGSEMAFVFDTLKDATSLLGDAPPQPLADRIHGLWIDFATDGRLPWDEFDGETRQVYRLAAGAAAYEAPFPAAQFVPSI